MSARQAILAHVLRELFPADGSRGWAYHEPITDDNADDAREAAEAANPECEDWIVEALGEFRASGDDAPGCGLDVPFSRHYESKPVARQLDDGRCVAWVYWYGGGKYGEPGEIEWLGDAIFVESWEETITVRRYRALGVEPKSEA